MEAGLFGNLNLEENVAGNVKRRSNRCGLQAQILGCIKIA